MQADDSQDAHTFIINVKIGILVQCKFSVLSRASHFEQVITQAASWKLLLICLLRESCRHARRRDRIQTNFEYRFTACYSFFLSAFLCFKQPLKTLKQTNYFRQWHSCGLEGSSPMRSAWRLSHNEGANVGMQAGEHSSDLLDTCTPMATQSFQCLQSISW